MFDSFNLFPISIASSNEDPFSTNFNKRSYPDSTPAYTNEKLNSLLRIFNCSVVFDNIDLTLEYDLTLLNEGKYSYINLSFLIISSNLVAKTSPPAKNDLSYLLSPSKFLIILYSFSNSLMLGILNFSSPYKLQKLHLAQGQPSINGSFRTFFISSFGGP